MNTTMVITDVGPPDRWGWRTYHIAKGHGSFTVRSSINGTSFQAFRNGRRFVPDDYNKVLRLIWERMDDLRNSQ